MPLAYDAPLAYDSPAYTYDGEALAVLLGIKEALYRELRFGGALEGLLDPSRVKLDMRQEVASSRDAYPYLVFRRVTSSEDNRVR